MFLDNVYVFLFQIIMNIHELRYKSNSDGLCGVSARKGIRPYFFKDEKGNTGIINGDSSKDMIRKCFLPQLVEINMDV